MHPEMPPPRGLEILGRNLHPPAAPANFEAIFGTRNEQRARACAPLDVKVWRPATNGREEQEEERRVGG